LHPGRLVDVDFQDVFANPYRTGAGGNLRPNDIAPDGQSLVLVQAFIETQPM
jgi:hypothetical protein